MLLLPSKASNLLARRSLLTGSGRAVLSATAVGLLVGCTAKAGTMHTADTSKADVDILNTALALEYEGIAAYQVGAESGLLQPPALGGQPDGAMQALEQPAAEILFENPDLPAERGAGHPQLAGRMLEAEMAGGRLEGDEAVGGRQFGAQADHQENSCI